MDRDQLLSRRQADTCTVTAGIGMEGAPGHHLIVDVLRLAYV